MTGSQCSLVRSFGRCLLLAALAAELVGQAATPRDLKALEAQIVAVGPRINAATVSVFNGSGGSGVIVTSDGWVLTAAHVLRKPRASVLLTLAEKRSVTARVVGVLPDVDGALLKIDQPGPWPHCPMAVKAPEKGALVLATGTPWGSARDRGSLLRFGTLLQGSPTFLRTTCGLDQGDSGGPLFDLQGNVVGIHSRIGYANSDNYHVSVDVWHREWEELVSGKRPLPEEKPPTHLVRRPRLESELVPWRRSAEVRRDAAKIWRPLEASLVKISSHSGRPVLGTLVTADGWIATKASELGGEAACLFSDGSTARITALREDPSWDLALVKVEVSAPRPFVVFNDAVALRVGSLLVAPVPGDAPRLGILGALPRAVAPIGATLGVRLEATEGQGARIVEVPKGTAGARAHLMVGDVITAFDGVLVDGPHALIGKVRALDPWAAVKLTLKRQGRDHVANVVLGSRRDTAAHRLGVPHRPDPLVGLPLSRRRSGFPQAFPHDALGPPRLCGGPLLDLDGHCVGLNIARSSRRSGLGIPARAVNAFVKKVAQKR